MKKVKTIRNKLLTMVLALTVVIAQCSFIPAFATESSYKNGTYQGTGKGRNGDITLSVTVNDDRITDISEISQSETPNFWERAKALFQDIIEANSTEVDAISSATLSSNGIKEAVNDALEKAAYKGIFAYGSGSAQDPYVINTIQQLADFALSVDSGENYAEQYISLDADIDLGEIESWNPIGAEGKTNSNAGKLFAGVFNGNGHTISNLKIGGEYTEEANVGLFSSLADTARVNDIVLIDANIDITASGSFVNARAGGIAGDTARTSGNRAAIIDGCSVSGKISVSTENGSACGGGILGRAFTKSAIINCQSSADINVKTDGAYNAAYAGGVAGMTGNSTVLANCVSFGEIKAANLTGDADAYAGGITGLLTSSFYNCYSLSNVTLAQKSAASKKFIGALAGQQAASLEGAMNYYSKDAKLTLRDENNASSSVSPIAWSADDMNGQATAEAMNDADMKTANFANTLNGNLSSVSDALNEEALALREWELESGNVVLSNTLWVPSNIDETIFESGAGTKSDPYIIMTKEQLKAFAASLNERLDYKNTYIKLGDDMDISGENWKPIGGSFYRFDGDFDGNGKTISGLTEGTENTPLVLDGSNAYIGLFGWLNEHAKVYNLNLDDVSVYTNSPGTAYVGGIAGRISGTDTEGDYRGTLIDGCVVKGVIHHTTDEGTTFIGGVAGHMFKGTIINTMTDVDMVCVEKSGQLAEAGGIAGLLNRGLVANCYTLGNVTGSGYRDTSYDIEGMACIGTLVGVNGGYITNCYGEGDVTALEYSIDTGVLVGWVTGIAKVYGCYYNETAIMMIDGRVVSPVDPIGEKVAGGVSDEWGFKFPGSLIDGIYSYTPDAEGASKVADGLNAAFAAFPIDIQSLYGLGSDSLRKWTAKDSRAILSDERAQVVYSQPEIEKETEDDEEDIPQDGTWFGRSADKSTVVEITVKNGEITKTDVLSGETNGDNYDYAVMRARYKAIYGDESDYSQADLSKFKGKGTESNPYKIENEEQLRYLAKSINEDVDWSGVYFIQTNDITLSDEEWKPIGWGIFADADGDGFGQDVVALYPFRGYYDGGNHTIKNVKAGSKTSRAHGNWMGLFGIIQGEYEGNEIPESDVNVATLKNIKLEDISFYTENRWRSYIGGLVGNAQGGFVIDNCSVTGVIDSVSTEDFAFAGGVAGSLMYGCVSDCSTNVDASAYSETNYSYTAGMSAVTNRATIINSYTLGDVHGDAGQTNRAEAGGFVALDGGLCVNCYAKGNVEIISKYSMYMGGFAGMAASSSEHRQCYYNVDASQKITGSEVSEKRYAGKFVNESAEANAQEQTAEFMSSSSFKDLLETNRKNISTTLSEVRKVLGANENGSSEYHSVYYNGNGSDLNEWIVENEIVGFNEKENTTETKTRSGGSSSGGSRSSVIANGNTSQETENEDKFNPSGSDNIGIADKNSNFEDIDNHWAKRAIDFAVAHGLFYGISDTLFAPDEHMSRAMLAAVLYRLEGAQATGGTVFDDVPGDAWYADSVSWAYDEGIVSGTGDGFEPDRDITREELVAILHRYAETKDMDMSENGDLSVFADADNVSEWAHESMQWAVGSGLIAGYEDGTIAPSGTATRAEVASIMQRLILLMEK